MNDRIHLHENIMAWAFMLHPLYAPTEPVKVFGTAPICSKYGMGWRSVSIHCHPDHVGMIEHTLEEKKGKRKKAA